MPAPPNIPDQVLRRIMFIVDQELFSMGIEGAEFIFLTPTIDSEGNVSGINAIAPPGMTTELMVVYLRALAEQIEQGNTENSALHVDKDGQNHMN